MKTLKKIIMSIGVRLISYPSSSNSKGVRDLLQENNKGHRVLLFKELTMNYLHLNCSTVNQANSIKVSQSLKE